MSTIHSRTSTRKRSFLFGGSFAVIAMIGTLVAYSPAQGATKRTKYATRMSLVFLGDERTIAAGAAGVFSFTVTPNGRMRSPMAFDVPDLPSGTSATVTSAGGTSYKLNVSTTASSTGGSAVYALRARSGSLSSTANFRLTVAATPCVAPPTTAPPLTTVASTTAPVGAGDFAISSSTAAVNATPNQTSALTVVVTRNNGFTGPVTFKADGIPANVVATFAPSPTTTGTTLYVTPGTAALSGTYLMVISASAGSTTRSIAQALVITRTGSFAFSMSPSALSTPQGMAASTTVTVGPAGSETIAPDVKFSISGAPSGVALLTPITTGTSTKLTFLTSAALTPGIYRFIVRGTSGAYAQGLQLTLTVRSNVPGYGLSASPTNQTVERGSSVSYAIAVARTNNFGAPITFNLTGLPPSATAVFEPTAAGVTLTIKTLATMAPTSYPLQVTGTSGALVSSVSLTLTVTSPAV
jgi:hypothetical protein